MASNSPRGVPPKRSDEREYYRLMRQEYLTPFLDGVLEEVRRQGATTAAGELAAVAAFVEYWRRTRDPAFPVDAIRTWARGLDMRHSKAFMADMKRIPGGPPNSKFKARPEPDILEQTIIDSVSLITTIPQDYHGALAVKLARAERIGHLDLNDRRRIFKEVGNLSGYKLRRITRDQSNKLTGALNIHRLSQAGLNKYMWSTSQDERVRPAHASREGLIFELTTGTGVPGDMHPGQAIQCRCVAVAYTPPSDDHQGLAK